MVPNLQGVTVLPETGGDGPVTLTEHEAIALSGGQIFVTTSDSGYKGEITSI